MAQQSHLGRYRPAILAVTGVAAAYGVYLIYNTLTVTSTGSGLHRSNAVHKTRPRPLSVDILPAVSTDAPLGVLQVRRDDRTITRNLATQSIPSRDELRDALGLISDSDIESMHEDVVLHVLEMCFIARTNVQRDLLKGFGMDGLVDALERRDVDDIKQCSVQIMSAAAVKGLDRAVLDRVVDNFIKNASISEDFYREQLTQDGTDFAHDVAGTEDLEGANGAPREPSQPLKGLLYHIAEEDARRQAYEHRGIHCEECGEGPIRGVRYHCLNCPDFDLCATCETQTAHVKTHLMVKIKIPLPVLSQPTKAHPLWYPGDPRKLHSPLNTSVRKRLAAESGFEEPKIDALYDHFTCMANVPWTGDPDKIQAAIDRRAFNKALTSEQWVNRLAPNAVHDRMFAFYDTNQDGKIGFGEFIRGMSYLRGPKRFASLRRALKGFDFDDDGIVSRADFMRLFKAKYAIQKQIVSEIIESHEDEVTYAAMDVLRSSQPISSIFNQEEIPHGVEMPRHGKQMNRYGDMQPLPGVRTILDDEVYKPRQHEDPAVHGYPTTESSTSPDDLRKRVLRLEEMLYGSTEQQSVHAEALGQVDGCSASGDAAHPGSDSMIKDDLGYRDSNGWDPLADAIADGFFEMLNPLFEAREEEDKKLEATCNEREKWSKEIERSREERKVFQEELRQAAMIDPLMATADQSFGSIYPEPKIDEQGRGSAGSESIPLVRAAFPFALTDSDSLAEREAAIAEQSLEDLLAATGYSTMETDETDEALSSAMSAEQPSTTTVDPTLPQHRPDTAGPSAADVSNSNRLQNKIESPPSMERLEYLATLDDAEVVVKERGGPGRLTFEEVEAIVKADSSMTLRALVTSWLEWASF